MAANTLDRSSPSPKYVTTPKATREVPKTLTHTCNGCHSQIHLSSLMGWNACRACYKVYCRSCLKGLELVEMLGMLAARLCEDCGGTIGI